jgi:hypothetical protein
MAKSSTKLAPNPRRRRRKPAARKANPARKARRAVARKPRRARRHVARASNPRKAHRRHRNPVAHVRRKRRKNPDTPLTTLIISAAVGSGVAVGISAVAQGLLASQIKDRANLSVAGNLSAAAVGGIAYYFGHKKSIKWLKWGGAGCLVSGIAFAVKDFAGNKIEAQVESFMKPKTAAVTTGYRRVPATQGYRMLSSQQATPASSFAKSGQAVRSVGY